MGNKTVGIFTVSSTTAKTASRSLNHCLSIPTLCPCSGVLAEAFLRLCHERLGKWSGCTFPCHSSSCWGIPAAQLTDKLLQLNACLLLTPASLQKSHPCLFWFISQKNAREGNEGGDSLNLHWRLNCKNSEKASQQLNPIWISITALRTSSQPYAHTSLSALADTHLCGKMVQGTQFVRSLIMFLCQGCFFFWWLTTFNHACCTVRQTKRQLKTESSNREKGTEQEYNCKSSKLL